MRDLEVEHHLDWAERYLWAHIVGGTAAVFTFLMFALFGLPNWVWWATWPVLIAAVVAKLRSDHHRREAKRLMWRSYSEPWWLGTDKPLEDWRDR